MSSVSPGPGSSPAAAPPAGAGALPRGDRRRPAQPGPLLAPVDSGAEADHLRLHVHSARTSCAGHRIRPRRRSTVAHRTAGQPDAPDTKEPPALSFGSRPGQAEAWPGKGAGTRWRRRWAAGTSTRRRLLGSGQGIVVGVLGLSGGRRWPPAEGTASGGSGAAGDGKLAPSKGAVTVVPFLSGFTDAMRGDWDSQIVAVYKQRFPNVTVDLVPQTGPDGGAGAEDDRPDGRRGAAGPGRRPAGAAGDGGAVAGRPGHRGPDQAGQVRHQEVQPGPLPGRGRPWRARPWPSPTATAAT